MMVNGQVCEAMMGQVGKVFGCLPTVLTSNELCVWGGDGQDVCGW